MVFLPEDKASQPTETQRAPRDAQTLPGLHLNMQETHSEAKESQLESDRKVWEEDMKNSRTTGVLAATYRVPEEPSVDLQLHILFQEADISSCVASQFLQAGSVLGKERSPVGLAFLETTNLAEPQ